MRGELRSLSKANADEVARHLVMIGRLLPDQPEEAYAHAMAAQRRAGRVAVVREIVGVAAYHSGRWAEALSELRAARRMSGLSHMLPMMADAERGLGRPERALDLAASPEASTLSTGDRVELAVVVSGARRDLGQPDAAVLALQIPELNVSTPQPWSARLWYAYADALLDAGRSDEALRWFARAAAADAEGTTDADERLAELEGLHIVDLEDEDAPAVSDPGAETTSETTTEARTAPEATTQPPTPSATEAVSLAPEAPTTEPGSHRSSGAEPPVHDPSRPAGGGSPGGLTFSDRDA